MRCRLPLLPLLLGLLPVAAHAQALDAATRNAVVESLAAQVEARYAFPDVGARIAASLRAKQAAGGYASATEAAALAEVLTQDLREAGHDRHFVVEWSAGGIAIQPDLPSRELSAAELAEGRAEMQRRAFGIDRVERLPGNVGVLELRGFGPVELVGDAYTAAMTLLQGSDAIILDLRRNTGGEPASVAFLLGHFFADRRHLEDIHSRETDSTQAVWTTPVPTPYTGPLYVLTSSATFSAGEEAAYDLQAQKRATIVGEVTGGGANPGEMRPLVHGFAAFIPTGRAINPVTGGNWEQVGVQPDVAAPATDALRVAHVLIVKELLAKSRSPEDSQRLQALLAELEKGAGPD